MRVDKIGMSSRWKRASPSSTTSSSSSRWIFPRNGRPQGRRAEIPSEEAVEGLIPDNIIYRKKMGFGAPMSDWMRSDFGRAGPDVSVFSSGLMRRGFLNASYIEKLFDWHFTGRTDTSLVSLGDLQSDRLV